MKQHFVVFQVPGGLVCAEEGVEKIDSWDVEKAVAMAKKDSYHPYSFNFTTRERGEFDLDSRETARSGTYYLGGQVRSLKDVRGRNDKRDQILISNMEGNKWSHVIVTSYGNTQPFSSKDTLLELEATATNKSA